MFIFLNYNSFSLCLANSESLLALGWLGLPFADLIHTELTPIIDAFFDVKSD